MFPKHDLIHGSFEEERDSNSSMIHTRSTCMEDCERMTRKRNHLEENSIQVVW